MISLDIYAVATKKNVAACAALFILLGLFPMQAAAMTVSDPGSYGYYDQFKELQTITDQVKGYYNQGKDFVGKIQGIKNQIEAIPSSVVGRVKEISSLLEDIGEFTEATDMLDGIFGDPRSPNYNPWKQLAPKYQLRQQGL
ncbi:hypothetical protein ADUPG1_001143, partial [Aduncisulcus paluster]